MFLSSAKEYNSSEKKLEAWSGAPVNNIVENMKHE